MNLFSTWYIQLEEKYEHRFHKYEMDFFVSSMIFCVLVISEHLNQKSFFSYFNIFKNWFIGHIPNVLVLFLIFGSFQNDSSDYSKSDWQIVLTLVQIFFNRFIHIKNT